MLRKEEEFELNGVMAGQLQRLANELNGMRQAQECITMVPATTLHQTFWQSGFRRGRVVPRGWETRNFGANARGISGGRDYQKSDYIW